MSAALWLDYAAVAVFALTGALAASRAQLDIVGFAFVACLTALGGGTARDVLLDRNPVFWIDRPGLVGVAVAAACVIFFTAHLAESRYRLLLWLDSFALGVAVPAGVAVAIEMDQPLVILILTGMITGTLGGMMRDVVCNEVPLVLKQGELYVTAAFAGSSAAALVLLFGGTTFPALLVCGFVTWALRAGSLAFGWQLPVYRARPPR